ncbi:signal peptidase II [Paeniroseomonas aquatica]|uniref:signal peptidase II n=1 Tax=Paeniroseomonas aquatica TaxID=373043 RepID=UPI003620BB49
MHLPTLGLLAAVAAFVADQATKAWALSTLWPPYSCGMGVLPVLNLRLGFNAGVTFGMFRDSAAGAVWVLVAVGLLVVAFLGSWLWRTRSGAEAVGLGLVIGGALGNILDRLRRGAVTDFLDAHYGGWHWPTFNVADIGIVCGGSLLLISADGPGCQARNASRERRLASHDPPPNRPPRDRNHADRDAGAGHPSGARSGRALWHVA